MLLREYLYQVTQQLSKVGIDTARLDARLLIGAGLNWSIEQLVARDCELLMPAQIEVCDVLVKRRLEREPMSYILGRKEFWGREFIVTKDTLTPRPDSESLIEMALNFISDYPSPKILDLGVGTGCLLLTLLMECKFATGVGVDISEEALDVAQKNAVQLACDKRVEWIKSDWLASVSSSGMQFDIIVSNPPYIAESDKNNLSPEVVQYEPSNALFAGVDGLDDYHVLARDLLPYLTKNGRVVLEIGFGQEEDIVHIMNDAGFVHESSSKDLAGVVRCLAFGVLK